MSTSTDISLEILEELDFEAAPPCEHTQHSIYHVPPDEPASLFVLAECHGCGLISRYLCCRPGYEQMVHPETYLECATCGEIEPGRDCVFILQSLR